MPRKKVVTNREPVDQILLTEVMNNRYPILLADYGSNISYLLARGNMSIDSHAWINLYNPHARWSSDLTLEEAIRSMVNDEDFVLYQFDSMTEVFEYLLDKENK